MIGDLSAHIEHNAKSRNLDQRMLKEAGFWFEDH